MFTLNAKLIEQAAASGSPRDFTQALANCATPLQHRGPMGTSGRGGVLGAGQYPEGYAIGGPQVDLNFINVEIPPWQNIPFTPTPLVDMPPYWSNDYRPSWPAAAEAGVGTWGGDPTGVAAESTAQRSPDGGASQVSAAEPALRVSGDVRLGDTTVKNVTTAQVRSQVIQNRSDINNRGQIRSTGSVTVGTPKGASSPGKNSKGDGGVHNHGNSYTGGTATAAGPSANLGTVTHSFITNHQTVNNYGPNNSFSTVNHHSTSNFYGPVNSYNTAVYRSDAYYQNLFAEGDVRVDQDLMVGRDATIDGDLLTLGNVEHRLGAGDVFTVNSSSTVKLVSVEGSAPASPSIQTRWLNAQVPVFLGGDTHLWRNYVYVSTSGNSATYTKLTLQKVDFVTDITWDNVNLSVEKTPFWVLALADEDGPTSTNVIECPV